MSQPIFTSKAHVFHIDPQTKRSWIPASCQAINVSFFYDSALNLYRIISIEGTKAVINSTITPNMTFTKTSQKFGQWSDIRANTVYGLGFASEPELNKFIEKFQEIKEATRNASHHKNQPSNASNTPASSRTLPSEDLPNTSQLPIDSTCSTSLSLLHNDINSPKSSLVTHQRSQSLSGLQANKHLTDNPKHGNEKISSNLFFPQSSTEAQLRYENDRLKLALAQSSANAKKWEIELQTLKNNNTRLTGALQESTANVEEWERQLQSLKDENNKMKLRIIELEASTGNKDAINELSKEINTLRKNASKLDNELKGKDKEIDLLKKSLEEHIHVYETSQKVDDKLKLLLNENDNLRKQLSQIHSENDNAKITDKAKKELFDQLNLKLAQSIQDLKSTHQELISLFSIS